MNYTEIKDELIENEVTFWNAFRGGDQNAYARFYEYCYPKLYTYGINVGMDDTQIRDAIQELFLKLYNKPHIIKETVTLLPFLFRSIRNYYLNLVKKENTRLNIEDYETAFSFDYTIEEHLVAEEDRQALSNKIKEILSTLTSRQREIIYFRFFYEMEYEEIAQILNITSQGARNMIYKAFEKIRKNYPSYLPFFIGII